MKKFLKKIIILVVSFSIILGGVGFWYFQKYDTPDYEHRGFFPLPKLKPIWERKVKSNQVTKIGIITDTHVHPSRINREDKRDEAPRYLVDKYMDVLNDFNGKMSEFNPNFIIHLGDVIEGTNDADFVGLMGLDLVENELKKTGVPIYWVIGNHELRSVNKEQFRQKFNLSSLNFFFDEGDYRFIFLDANYHEDGRESLPGGSSNDGFLPQETLNWLEPNLQTEKQVFIFVHHPLEGKNRKPIVNSDQLMVLLQKYNVKAVLSGHIEFKYFRERDGVQLFSLPGTKKNLVYQTPFYELTIEKGETKMRMFYKDFETNEEKIIDFKMDME